MATSLDVIAAARHYLGAPYMHQGRTPFVSNPHAVHGIDCIGLVILVAHDLSLSDFDIDGYGRVPSGRMMERLLREHCTELRPHDAGYGDLLHIAYRDEPHHLAFKTDIGMLHADNRFGVVEHVIDRRLLHKVRGAYRLPGLSDG